MGTDSPIGILSRALFGRTRRTLLALLFCNSEKEFYLRQIVRITGLGQGAVQRELANLTGAELILRRKDGHQVYYKANHRSPVFSELKSLMVKTAGVAERVRARLLSLADRITTAFIYGSVAKGVETARSDVDVIVVGSVTFSEVSDALGTLQDELGREVNPTVYSKGEFTQKQKAGHHFLNTVINEPKVFLIGDQNDLDGLVDERLAD